MMLLFKFQRADSSFTDFNGEFIKGFTLNLSADPAVRETNKYKQIENEGNKKCPAKMMLRPTAELLKGCNDFLVVTKLMLNAMFALRKEV